MNIWIIVYLTGMGVMFLLVLVGQAVNGDRAEDLSLLKLLLVLLLWPLALPVSIVGSIFGSR